MAHTHPGGLLCGHDLWPRLLCFRHCQVRAGPVYAAPGSDALARAFVLVSRLRAWQRCRYLERKRAGCHRKVGRTCVKAREEARCGLHRQRWELMRHRHGCAGHQWRGGYSWRGEGAGRRGKRARPLRGRSGAQGARASTDASNDAPVSVDGRSLPSARGEAIFEGALRARECSDDCGTVRSR